MTSAGTDWKPATIARNRISSVYVVSGMIAVSSDQPEDRGSSANAARLGIVYRTPVTAVIGA